MDIFLGVSGELTQLIMTVLPSVVIWLCLNRGFTSAMTAIGVMVTALALLRVTSEYIRRDLSDNSLHATNTLETLNNSPKA